MIPYIGDISIADAKLLAHLAWQSESILEFGCGASTQIFAYYGRGVVVSVDTEQVWIDRTKANVDRLAPDSSVEFVLYEKFTPIIGYDLIFVDGLNELRLPFAVMTWPALRVGGVMCFHDTRRTVPYGKANISDVEMVAEMVETFSMEIDTIAMNADNSNTTVIRKRARLYLEDWAKIEGRTPEQLGIQFSPV